MTIPLLKGCNLHFEYSSMPITTIYIHPWFISGFSSFPSSMGKPSYQLQQRCTGPQGSSESSFGRTCLTSIECTAPNATNGSGKSKGTIIEASSMDGQAAYASIDANCTSHHTSSTIGRVHQRHNHPFAKHPHSSSHTVAPPLPPPSTDEDTISNREG